MPIVLVHGNPETAAIWDDLRRALGRDDVIALSPPGFGAPVPDGFGATSDDYVAWLSGELDRIQGPLHLVGHDWGGGHVMRLVLQNPERVRSWTMDIAGCFDPDYVWHDMAQIWQTPGTGEANIQDQLSIPVERRVAGYQWLGMSEAVARSLAQAYNADMGRCLLHLYRSAAQPKMAEWGAQLDRARSRHGLVIAPTEDHYTGGVTLAERSAKRAGAQFCVFEGLGHWWMCQDPQLGADNIRSLVEQVESSGA